MIADVLAVLRWEKKGETGTGQSEIRNGPSGVPTCPIGSSQARGRLSNLCVDIYYSETRQYSEVNTQPSVG